MYKFIFLLLILSISSCNNKKIELPQIAVAGKSDIQNHSQIWIFYKKNKDSVWADVNMNNKINTTHWIINIDRHLTLDKLTPVFQKIKENRNKKSIHSKDGMHTYLSYSDMENKKIALFPIDSIQYLKIEIENQENTLRFLSDSFLINNKKFPTEQWDNFVLDTLNKTDVQLQFSDKLSYQQYMEYRLTVNSKLPKHIRIKHIEYIIEE
jgi:hypothetical protein